MNFSGVVQHSFLQVADENIAAYSEGKCLKVVKTEIMDPVGLPSLTYGNLRFSLSANAWSWLVSSSPTHCSMLSIQLVKKSETFGCLSSVFINSIYLLTLK